MTSAVARTTLALVLGLVAACAARKTSGERPSDPAPAAPAPDDGESAWQGAPDASAPTEAACMEKARGGDGEACNECCAQVHAAAWEKTWDALRACACRKPQPACTAECGPSYCAGTLRPEDATLACTTCVSDSWGDANYDCLEAFAVTCRPDRECMAFFTCLDDCDHPPGVDAGAADAAK